MPNLIVGLGVTVAVLFTTSGYAGSASCATTPSSMAKTSSGCNNPSGTADSLGENCATRDHQCYQVISTGSVYHKVTSCKTCNSGYNLVQKLYTAGSCTSVPYFSCVKATATDNGSGTCNSTTCTHSDWIDYSPGYQRQMIRTCVSGVCTDFQAIYRCSSGYYGKSASTMTGCTACPSVSGVYTNSARTVVPSIDAETILSTPGDNTTANDCYLAPNKTYYDVTGNFGHSTNIACYYDGTGAIVSSGSSGGDSSGSGVDCSATTGVCASSGGSSTGQVVSGFKSESGGYYCWCNVTRANKSFFVANMNTYCSNACSTQCSNWINNNTQSVATNLGCE